MPLVEVIAGVDTSETAIARALDYVGQLRKTPIVVRDSPGFFTSRVFSTFVHEGLKMLDDGVAPALIENAAKMAGFPTGPLAVSDEVTLSLQQSILKQQALDGIPEGLRIRAGSAVLDRMVDDLKRPGRRQGGGFYDYPPAAPKKLWTGLVKAFPPAARQPEARELQLRFLTIMALERRAMPISRQCSASVIQAGRAVLCRTSTRSAYRHSYMTAKCWPRTSANVSWRRIG